MGSVNSYNAYFRRWNVQFYCTCLQVFFFTKFVYVYISKLNRFIGENTYSFILKCISTKFCSQDCNLSVQLYLFHCYLNYVL